MTTKTIAVAATATNLLLQILDAEIFVDPIPHIGISEGNQTVKKGVLGKGETIKVDTPEGDIPKGKLVFFRKEVV